MYVKELKRAAALTLSAVLALGNIPVGGLWRLLLRASQGLCTERKERTS